MHFSPFVEQQVAEERYKDMARQVERTRLAREIGSPGTKYGDRILAKIGGLLITVGTKLRERTVPALPHGSESYRRPSWSR